MDGSIVGRRNAHARSWIAVCALAAVFASIPHPAQAVPSFASQTGLPCSQCHVVAFGPALTAYGRQFKLNGYTFAKQNGGFNIPLAATVLTVFDDPNKATPAPSPFSDEENLVVQDVSVFLAGRLAEHLGVFVKGTYDGVGKSAAWDNLDVRYARAFELGGRSVVAGITVNNNPTVQDLWSSTPVWSFPYVRSELAPFPSGAPVLRGQLANAVLGASAYAMVSGHLYMEAGFYRGVSPKWLANLGDAGGSPDIVGAAPYVRVAYEQQAGPHYFEVGAVGFSVKQEPFSTTTQSNRFTDYGIDATYQFVTGGAHSVDAHFSWIHEDRNLDASFASGASDATSNTLDSVSADVSYVLRQTWVGSVGLFNTSGTTNHLAFPVFPVFGSAAGSPASRGYRLQLEWVPFGKSDSFANPWVNLRLALQYTGFLRFNGGDTNYDGFGRSASDNNTLVAFAWLAF